MTAGRLHAFLKTPIGTVEVIESGGAVVEVDFRDRPPGGRSDSSPCLRGCQEQLDEYFRGRRRLFDLKLDPQGTDFQRRVWEALVRIPYGQTTSYGRIAVSLGNGRSVRAVGAANGRNPIPIIIPCHRVVGAGGDLIGYGGGLWRKKWLLDHEQSVSAADGLVPPGDPGA